MKSFKQRCYEKLMQVPYGKVTTYRELAHALGSKAYRAVGSAMATNQNAPHVPCHRVVNSDGKIGNYSAGGKQAKIELLKKEGISIKEGKIVNLDNVLFTF